MILPVSYCMIHTNITQINKKINFRPTSGVRNFENFISGFRKMQNLILGGVIRGIFKIQGCYVSQKSIFGPFGKKLPARMVTVNRMFLNIMTILK